MFFLFKFLQILSCRQELIKAPVIAGINPLKMKKLSNSELPKRSYNTINFSCSSFLVNVSPFIHPKVVWQGLYSEVHFADY